MNENIEAVEVGTKKDSNYILTLIMCWFFGTFGVHRFMNGKIGTGLLMIVTLGGLGIWKLVDLILLMTNSFKNKEGKIIGYEGKFFSNAGNIVILVLIFLEVILLGFLVFLYGILLLAIFSSIDMY